MDIERIAPELAYQILYEFGIELEDLSCVNVFDKKRLIKKTIKELQQESD